MASGRRKAFAAARVPASLKLLAGCRLSPSVWSGLRVGGVRASLLNPGGAGPRCASDAWAASGIVFKDGLAEFFLVARTGSARTTPGVLGHICIVPP